MKDFTGACTLLTMETGSTDTQRNLEKDVTDLIQTMGQTLNMALLYGVTHKVTQSSLAVSFTVISKFIEFHENIHFSVADGSLLINGASTAGSPLAASFTTRLTGLNLFSFTIESGFTQDECLALFTLLLTPPSKIGTGKSATDLMEGLGLLHIQAKSFSYRRVSEDEPAGGIPATPAPETPAAEPTAAQPDLDNIMAFLQDDTQADPNRSIEDIRHLAADTEKLAELILRSVEIRSSLANLSEGESLADLIVGCIQKAVQPIIKDPAAKTQKGRKQIKHSLVMLEKALLDRLKALSGDQAAVHATEAMMEEIVEDLDLEAIASKYVKNRRLAEKSCEKLNHLIERSADDPEQLKELRERLIDQGLTQQGWLELSVKHAAPATPSTDKGGGSGDGINEIKMLTILLAQIGETIQNPAPSDNSSEVQALITEAGQHLSSLTDITDKKIVTLHAMLTDEKHTPVLSHRELLEILAEIAQEIMQPLTIITGTVAMIRSLKAGPFTNTQGELLSMIAESSDRMILLVKHLMDLAGTPVARQPDRTILDAAYTRN